MPQFGRISAASAVAPSSNGGSPSLPWTILGATVQMVTFEVDIEAALDALPAMLSRPAPPYARLLLTDYPDSPVGPYREALLLVACRFAMLPRQYIAASLVTCEGARAANLELWKYQSVVGDIDATRDGSRFSATIKAPGVEVAFTSGDAQETGVAAIRYDPTLVVADGEQGPGLFTVSSEPDAVSSAWIARDAQLTYAVTDRSSVWWKLRSLNPITSTIAIQDMELVEPRPVRSSPMVSAG